MFGASIAVAFVYLINITKGEPSLIVLKNAEQPVTSIIITTRGRNLTLTCKIVMNEKQPFDGRVVWSKKTNNLRLPIKKELKKQTVGRSKLRFEPLTVWDGDIYVCSNLKHNISKVVSVIVRPQELVDHLRKRLKRAQNDHGRHQWGDWNTRKKLPTENPTPSLPDPMRDSVANVIRHPKKKYKPTEPTWINSGSFMNWDRSNEVPGSFNGQSSFNFGSTNLGTSSRPGYSSVSRSNPKNTLEKASSLDNVTSRINLIEKTHPDTIHESDNNSTPKSKSGVLYYIMAFVGCLMMFTGFICRCIHNDPNQMQWQRSALVCQHPACRLHRNINQSVGCLFRDGPYDSAPTPTAVVATTHDDITVVTADRMPGSVNRCATDTPPLYTTSIQNQNDSDLPPSYEEALANMMQPAPPNYFSLTGISSATPAPPADCSSPSALPEVFLDVLRGFARFVPSFFDNNRH